MAFRPVGNGAEVVVKATSLGVPIVTTFGFLGSVAFDGGDLFDLTAAVMDAWRDNAFPQLPSTYQAFEAVGRGLRTANDVEATVPFEPTTLGGLLGSALPNNCSLSISRRTGLTGRSRRGRLFWPSLVEADVTANEVSVTRADAILSALIAFTTEVNAGGIFSLAVISRQENGVQLNPGIARPVASWSIVDRRVDSQRRRLS